jgi:hypothetical protein
MDAKAEKILLGANYLSVLDAGYPNDPGQIGPRRQLYVANKYRAQQINRYYTLYTAIKTSLSSVKMLVQNQPWGMAPSSLSRKFCLHFRIRIDHLMCVYVSLQRPL